MPVLKSTLLLTRVRSYFKHLFFHSFACKYNFSIFASVVISDDLLKVDVS